MKKRIPSVSLSRKIISFPLTRIIIALFFVAVATIGRDVSYSLLSDIFLFNDVGSDLIYMILTILIVHFSYLLYVKLIERRAVSELSMTGFSKELISGIAIGFGLFTGIMAIIWGLGYYTIIGINNWTVIISIFTSSVIAGYVEEIVARGIIFRIVEESLGTWLAVIISASVFGILHILNPNASVVSSLAIASTAGVLLAASYIYKRRLWLPIGIHFAWNFTQGGIFGVTVSGKERVGLLDATLDGPELITGGSFGPESSIITVILGFSIGIYFLLNAYRNKKTIAPFWTRNNL